MSELRYIATVTGDVIELDGPLTYVGTALNLRARKWSYKLGFRNLVANKAAREAKLTGWTRSEAEMDRAERAFDADIAAGRPGTIECGRWSQHAYIVNTVPKKVHGGSVDYESDVLLMDGSWRKPETFHLFPSSGDASGTKVYPYVYPYTYSGSYGARFIDIEDTARLPFLLRIFGFAASPQIRIGNNVYQFDISVPKGGYLEIDTRSDPTVTLVTEDGTRTDEFHCAERGSGEGCGVYAFEPIPYGKTEARWNDSFGFDLTVFHESVGLPYEPDNR